jgi:WD40 repeat protein
MLRRQNSPFSFSPHLLWLRPGHLPGRAGAQTNSISPLRFATFAPSAGLAEDIVMSLLHVRTAVLAYTINLIPALVFAQGGIEKPKPPEQLREKLSEPQVAVRFSPDGSRFAVCGQNNGIRQYDRTGKELAALKNAPGGWSVAYSPDGKIVAACGLDRSIRLWHADTGKEIRTLEGHSQTAWEAYFAPNGQTLVSIGEDCTIRFWNIDDGKEFSQLNGHPGAVWSMSLSADGRMLATGGSDGAVRLWDLTTGRLRRTCDSQHNGGVWPLAFSPDGKTVASGGWQDGNVHLWETSTGKKRRKVPHPSGAKSLVFTPDGRTLISAGNDSVIRFWDLLTGDQLPALEGHGATVNAIAISPDGSILVSASSDQTMRIWDLTGRTVARKMNPVPSRQLEAHWMALLRDDGPAAFDAMGALTAVPEQTLALIRDRLRPAAVTDIERIAAMISDTGHVQFAVREKASEGLSQLGEEAEPHLMKAMYHPTSAETRRRAERLLRNLENSGLTGETLRAARAVELLERIATDDARRMLATLADGAADACLTIDAQMSLKRLAK